MFGPKQKQPSCGHESGMKKDNVKTAVVTMVAGIILWDIYLASDEVDKNTISKLVRDVSDESPMIPFALGVLIGHWFWDNN